jgi:hypothetical protein
MYKLWFRDLLPFHGKLFHALASSTRGSWLGWRGAALLPARRFFSALTEVVVEITRKFNTARHSFTQFDN